MFKAYYDPNRFRFLNVLKERRAFKHAGGEVLRKTACFLGEKFNVFIDSSDGINEDLPINEYCGRIKLIVEKFDKPFLYFKCNHSREKTSDIERIAKQHGGRVLPFFMWNLHSQNPKFYSDILPNRTYWIEKNKNQQKEFDIMYAASKKVYQYPKPNAGDDKIAWSDYRNFGLGTPKDTGWYELGTRNSIYDVIDGIEGVSIERPPIVEYMQYMENMTKYRVQFSPPGVGEYSCRIFNGSAIGQCMLLRKNTYDFYDSWKEYFPEVDVGSDDLEAELTGIVRDYREWGEKSRFYFENSLSESRMIEVFILEVEKFGSSI
jgi:hypothetical protein